MPLILQHRKPEGKREACHIFCESRKKKRSRAWWGRSLKKATEISSAADPARRDSRRDNRTGCLHTKTKRKLDGKNGETGGANGVNTTGDTGESTSSTI